MLLLVVDLESLLPEVREEDTPELLLPLLETPTLLKSTSELLVLPLLLLTEELPLLLLSFLVLLPYPARLRSPVFLKLEYVLRYFE